MIFPIGLGLVGLIVYHTWITTLPLAAGDWQWMPPEQVRTWFPSPTVWWPEIGFGLKNFGGVYEMPVEAVGGLLALAGADWRFGEKILYFWPFAILSFAAPWLLARELLRSSWWALLSSLIYGTSTYFMTFSAGGQMYLAVAEGISPIVIYCLIKTLRIMSLRWALVTGLLLGIQAMYEVRIAYLTIFLALLYVAFLLMATPTGHQVLARIGLVALAFAVFAGTQVYWVLPLLTYRGDNGLPFSPEPWIAFMSIINGITGAAPYWTGAAPAIFHYTPVIPTFFLFPIVAFAALYQRRFNVELVWLSTAALIAAFLVKQTNPPFGSIYEWMFRNVPGWSLFREGSKFYFVLALTFAILIPSALRQALGRTSPQPQWRFLSRAAVVSLLVATVVVSSMNLIPLETGQIGYTTQPVPEPDSFKQLSSLLDQDQNYGAVIWLGGAWINDPSGTDHDFAIRSARHPMVELLGSSDTGDPWVAFCHTPSVGFCYLDQQLLPYLLKRSGVRYVVAPADPTLGQDLPTLPWSTNVVLSYRTTLDRLNSILGSPQILDDGKHRIAYWKLDVPPSPVVSAPAITVVVGPPATTVDALPGIEALGLPVAYSSSNGGSLLRARLPQSIEVLPEIQGTYAVQTSGEYVVLAASPDANLKVVVNGASLTLHRVVSQSRRDGWSGYGPLFISNGLKPFRGSAAVQLGPLLEWSQLTRSVIGSVSPEQSAKKGQLLAERVTAESPDRSLPWIELKRTYDPGWQLDSATVHLNGDGTFNLYYSNARKSELTFSFSTAVWESAGLIFSIAWIILCILGWLAIRHRTLKRFDEAMQPMSLRQAGPIRRTMDAVGRYGILTAILLLALATLFQFFAWSGIPSIWPQLVPVLGPAAAEDPYRGSEYFVEVAMLVLAIASVLRLPMLVQWKFSRRRASPR